MTIERVPKGIKEIIVWKHEDSKDISNLPIAVLKPAIARSDEKRVNVKVNWATDGYNHWCLDDVEELAKGLLEIIEILRNESR